MKNRRAPVLLFGVVVLAVAGVALWNASTVPAGEGKSEEQKKAEQVKEQSMSPEARKQTEEELRGALSGNKTDEHGHEMPESAKAPGADGEGMATKPTILVDKFKPYKPVPNDSSTATHWYDEQSRTAKITEERSRTGG